jgi:hypothetical protein
MIRRGSILGGRGEAARGEREQNCAAREQFGRNVESHIPRYCLTWRDAQKTGGAAQAPGCIYAIRTE